MSDTPDDGLAREKRDVRVTMRVPRRLHAAMRRLAEHDRRSLSDWLIVQLQDVIAAKETVANKGSPKLFAEDHKHENDDSMNNPSLRSQSGTKPCGAGRRSDKVREARVETETTSIIEDAVARIATIPSADDPFEDPAWDAAGEILEQVFFGENDALARRVVQLALYRAYLKSDAEGVREVMRDALECAAIDLANEEQRVGS